MCLTCVVGAFYAPYTGAVTVAHGLKFWSVSANRSLYNLLIQLNGRWTCVLSVGSNRCLKMRNYTISIKFHSWKKCHPTDHILYWFLRDCDFYPLLSFPTDLIQRTGTLRVSCFLTWKPKKTCKGKCEMIHMLSVVTIGVVCCDGLGAQQSVLCLLLSHPWSLKSWSNFFVLLYFFYTYSKTKSSPINQACHYQQHAIQQEIIGY